MLVVCWHCWGVHVTPIHPAEFYVSTMQEKVFGLYSILFWKTVVAKHARKSPRQVVLLK